MGSGLPVPLKLYSLLLNNLHCARPNVCAPDNATRSLVLSPTAVNLAVMLVKLSNGVGMEELAPAWFAVKLSLLPSSTVHEGPPCRETEASAARARMSAQETMPGQEFSRAVLMLSTTLNPRVELVLGAASFSLCMLALLSNKMEPSHPLTKQSWKWRRMRLAPIRTSDCKAC